jgi:hypothetical protein
MNKVRSGIMTKVKEDMTLKEFKEHLHAMEIALHRHVAYKVGHDDVDRSIEDMVIEVEDGRVKLSCWVVEDLDGDPDTIGSLAAWDIQE